MKKVVALIMLVVMMFGLCACSGNKADVVGIWKAHDNDSDNTQYLAEYLYVYESGYCKIVWQHSSSPEYEVRNSLDWEYDGKIFKFSDHEEWGKYTVEDDKMFLYDELYATRVDTDTSNEKPSYNE